MNWRDMIGYEGEEIPSADTAPAAHSLIQLAKATMSRIGATVSGGPSVQSMLSSILTNVSGIVPQVSAAWWGLQKNVSGLATQAQVSAARWGLETNVSGLATQAQVSAAWWGLKTNVSGLAPQAQVSSAMASLNMLISGVMALTETGGTITLDSSEQTAYLNNTPATVYRPKTFLVDCTNTSGYGVTYKESYRIQASGNMVQHYAQMLSGLGDNALWSRDLLPNRFGAKLTLQGLAAQSGKTMDWAVFYEG